MPIRNWVLIAASGIAIVAGVSLAALIVVAVQKLALENIQSYRDEQSRAAADQKQAAEQIARECAIPGAPVDLVGECLAGQISARQRDNSTSVDAEAQQDMAYWAKIMAYISAATVPISLAGLGALLLSLRQTRQAISISQEIGHAQVRAYISITPHHLVVPEETAVGAVGFNFVNNGQSPAYKVHGYSLLFVGEYPPTKSMLDKISMNDWMPTFDGNIISASNRPTGWARPVFPIDYSWYVAIIENDTLAIYFNIIIKYEVVFQKETRNTNLLFYLNKERGEIISGENRSFRHNGWHPVDCYTWAN